MFTNIVFLIFIFHINFYYFMIYCKIKKILIIINYHRFDFFFEFSYKLFFD